MDKLQNKEVSKGLRRNRQLLRAGMDFGYSVSLPSRPCMLIFLMNGLEQNSHLPEWKLCLLCSEPHSAVKFRFHCLQCLFQNKMRKYIYGFLAMNDVPQTMSVIWGNLCSFGLAPKHHKLSRHHAHQAPSIGWKPSNCLDVF